MTTKQKAAVMLAADAGAEIERAIAEFFDNTWEHINVPEWNWSKYIYRVKPGEPRRIWVNIVSHPKREILCSAAYYKKEVAEENRQDGCITTEFVEVVK